MAINELEANGIRDPEEPLGYDGDGNAYWYFSGVRLYRESPEEDEDEDEVEIAPPPVKKKAASRKYRGKKRKKSPKMKLAEEKEKEMAAAAAEAEAEAAAAAEEALEVHPLQTKDDRWQVICQTVQEWEELLPTLRGKRNTPQWELHKLVSAAFRGILFNRVGEGVGSSGTLIHTNDMHSWVPPTAEWRLRPNSSGAVGQGGKATIKGREVGECATSHLVAAGVTSGSAGGARPPGRHPRGQAEGGRRSKGRRSSCQGL